MEANEVVNNEADQADAGERKASADEIEMLEFRLGDNYFGIEAAMVKEIMDYTPVTVVPNSHPCFEGIIMPRDAIISVIDPGMLLNISEAKKSGNFIVTNLRGMYIAFHVDQVNNMERCRREDIHEPDSTIKKQAGRYARGIIKKDGRLVILLDAEKVLNEVSPED
ncbi:MAG: chemotaxis protein CheW [Lachnospiraceae bacterium]|jgi:two-component system chemotaxis response regulator CheV|nr:chemotaxis protein CheW [Lachnospiraceae bacterium]MEE3461383.1 chemotaxis protein CheW [Lachnospiraceae bacterium]